MKNIRRSPSLPPDQFIEQNGRQYVAIETLVHAVAFPIIMAPFYGGHIPCKVRELRQIELEKCGQFSLIETFADKLARKRAPSKEEAYQYAKLHHKICERAMISPTYNDMFKHAKSEIDMDYIEKEIQEIYQIARTERNDTKRIELENEIHQLEMASKFILPSEFTSYIVSYAVELNKSDIKDITSEMLLQAAIKALNGHGNPSDYIHGNFNDHNIEDINTRAWIEYAKTKEK